VSTLPRTHGPSPELLRLLASIAFVSAVATGVLIALVAAQSSLEFWFVALVCGAAAALYVRAAVGSPARLFPLVALAPCIVMFFVVGENLVTLDRLTGLDISRRLTLSSRLSEVVEAQLPRDEWFETFGHDSRLYRRVPGSLHRSAYEAGPRYEATVDQYGFLNEMSAAAAAVPDVVIAGDSVIQGVGMPGVAGQLGEKTGLVIYSVSTGGYGPLAKSEALRAFGLTRRPRVAVLEFYAGNDATDAIEDEACAAVGGSFRCRFIATEAAEALRRDPVVGGYGRFGHPDWFMRSVTALRADRLSLAFGTEILQRARRITASRAHRTHLDPITFEGEALSLPGFSRFDVSPGHHRAWVARGLALATRSFDRAREASAGVEFVVMYNPSAYEIFRDVLPSAIRLPHVDEISTLQRDAIGAYAASRGLRYCDLTSPFREHVSNGARGLFGKRDGTHWSPSGTSIAASVLAGCVGAEVAPADVVEHRERS
jgi:hypothetical protein